MTIDIDYSKIPKHMMEGIKDYVENGTPQGGFLTAIFANDLYKAVGRADSTNIKILPTYVSYILWETPSECSGSYEKVRDWINSKNPKLKVVLMD